MTSRDVSMGGPAPFLSMLALCLLTGTSHQESLSAQQVAVAYHADWEYGKFETRVTATVNGQVYQVIPAVDSGCLVIVSQQDFDGNGTTDALIEDLSACGGNGAGSSYFFISYLGEGYFRVSNPTDCCARQDPVIEGWQGRPSVVVTLSNEGVNQEDPETTRIRYVLRSGEAVKVEESTKGNLVALAELRYAQFTQGRVNQVLRLRYDLNRDGVPDTLFGTPWERWGRINWSARLSGVGDIPERGDANCKRLGVLGSMTNGVHDLVCDQDTILRWDPRARTWQSAARR